MQMRRREFLAAATLISAGALTARPAARGEDMYGLIAKMTAADGKRDELIATLVAASADMPGCLSYIVAKDAADASAIWVTEVWDSKESHDASLSLPQVKGAITKARPIISGFGERFVTTPVDGLGLARRSGSLL